MSSLKEEIIRGPTRISNDAMKALQQYNWPGNVRELRNVLERAVIIAKGNEITSEDLPGRIKEYKKKKNVSANNNAGSSLRNTLEAAERNAIIEALRSAEGNKVKASKILNIHRTGLYQKIKKHQIVV
jgi:DNA-binding NtrC family response regulator